MKSQEKPEQIQRYRSYSKLLAVICNASLSGFNFGYSNGYFNSMAFDDIIEIFALQDYSRDLTQGVLTGCLSITGGIGAFISSYFIKNYSRKQCYQIIGVSMIVTCLLLITQNLTIFFVGRLIQGLLIGMTSTLNPLFVKQFSPIQLSNKLTPITQLSIVSGLTYAFLQAYILSLIFPPYIYWRMIFGFPMVVSIFQLYNIKYKYPYETPKWLLTRKRKEQALQILNVIYKQQYVKEVYDELVEAIQKQKKIVQSVNEFELLEFNKTDSQPMRQQLISGRVSIQLTSSKLAIIAAFTLFLNQQVIGMGAIISYSSEIVRYAYPFMEKVFPILINVLAVSCVFITSHALKRFGRKNSLLAGGILIVISQFFLARFLSGFNFDDISINTSSSKLFIMFFLLLIRAIFSVTFGPIVWIYVAEIVQANIIPYATMMNWFTVSLVTITFPLLRTLFNGNPEHIFDIYAILTLVGFIINWFILVETSNKNQLQIRRQFEEKWK